MSEPPGAGTLEEVRRLIAGQAKLLAIKRYREATGTGLAEAKAAVERIQAERLQAKATAVPPVGDRALAIGEALRAGNKIEAIKLYRAATGLGLKEAKDAIDAILAEKDAAARTRGEARGGEVIRRRRMSPALTLLALALVFGSVFGLVLFFSGK